MSRIPRRACSPLVTVEGELFSFVRQENFHLRCSLFGSGKVWCDQVVDSPASLDPPGSDSAVGGGASLDVSFAAGCPFGCLSDGEGSDVSCPLMVNRVSSSCNPDYAHSLSIRELTCMVLWTLRLCRLPSEERFWEGAEMLSVLHALGHVEYLQEPTCMVRKP